MLSISEQKSKEKLANHKIFRGMFPKPFGKDLGRPKHYFEKRRSGLQSSQCLVYRSVSIRVTRRQLLRYPESGTSKIEVYGPSLLPINFFTAFHLHLTPPRNKCYAVCCTHWELKHARNVLNGKLMVCL